MTAKKLNPETQNIEAGIIITASGGVDEVGIGNDIGRLCTGIKATIAGDIVWYNKHTDEYGFWVLEAGEFYMIGFTSIVSGATIRGVARTTTLTAAQLLWVETGPSIGEKDA